MRKFGLAVLSVIILSSFTACSALGFVPNLDKAYTFTAELTYGDMKTTADFSRVAPDNWTGEIMEPYALQGMSFTYSPEETNVSFGDMNVSHDDSGLGVTAFMMIAALEQAFTSGELEGADNNYNNYTLTLDKGGLPVSLEVKAPGQTVQASFVAVKTTAFGTMS